LEAVGGGTRSRIPLGLPSGVKAIDITPGARTSDAVATVLSIRTDRPLPGRDKSVADRTLVAGELRAYQTDAPLYIRLTAHEALTYAPGGALGAYDIATGVTRTLAAIKDDDRVLPTTMSGKLLMSSPGRTWVRLLDIDRDDRWHEAEVGVLLQTFGYALSRGRFLVFDEEGAPYVLDGAAARAAPSRTLPDATSPNATVGTIREARGASVGSKMHLAWRMPDGAPGSLDYFAGSLVVITPWTRSCSVCTEQLGILSDVANGTRSRVEIFGIGIDESEASALDAAKDYRRLRPLIASSAALKELGLGVVPETFVLDSDHIVRSRIVGPLSWEALVRALSAASKSRLAFRDGDVALS
jgi:peroxiredoxin